MPDLSQEITTMPDKPHIILPHGGYRRLRSFQCAEAVYDATVLFCSRFIDNRSRTHDQMVQAARSGVQNIAEGSVASATSKKTEMKLTNVARASLEELMLDYQDFLRQRGLAVWGKNCPQALAVRGNYQSDTSDMSDPYLIRTTTPEVAANTLICLINQASFLLGRQIQSLERQFREQGGFTERLHAVRTQERDRLEGNAPACPSCRKPMALRTARTGPNSGQQFWGCSDYPKCRSTRPHNKSDKSDKSDLSDMSDASDKHLRK
jgi:restriction system protein